MFGSTNNNINKTGLKYINKRTYPGSGNPKKFKYTNYNRDSIEISITVQYR